MIKKVIVSCCLVFSALAFAQERSASPYSYYGIGDMTFKGTVENRSMGGLGIIPDSIHVNLQNPASYSSLIFTNFTVGGTSSTTTFKTDNAESNSNRTTLDYLAVGLPVSKKLGVAFGLMPYSDVGYKIENTVTEGEYEQNRRFQGSGGLNRVFAGVAYKILPQLSIGIDGQYNFGNIETKSIVAVPNVPVQYPTREINESEYNGFSFNVGLMYQTKLKGKYDWFTSATFTPQATLSGNTERQYATITYANSGAELVVDELTVSVGGDDIKLPSKFTFGQSNELGNRFDNVTTAGFESGHKIALGGYYVPNYQSYNNYLKKITYRAGLKFEKTGLVINNEDINDYGVTLGLGLPLPYYTSNLNLGVELGRRGTTNANLIQENYVNFFVSFSLGDRWFIKRKYD
jgi:hypothetical protein